RVIRSSGSASWSVGCDRTTSTVPAVCGNNVVEPGEACDCGVAPCEPLPTNSGPFNTGGCYGPDGRFEVCAHDCSACLPAPVCGDGVFDPGDTCDYAFGFLGDQCPPGSRCTLTDPCRCSP